MGISVVVLLPAQTVSLSGASLTCWVVLRVETDPGRTWDSVADEVVETALWDQPGSSEVRGVTDRGAFILFGVSVSPSELAAAAW